MTLVHWDTGGPTRGVTGVPTVGTVVSLGGVNRDPTPHAYDDVEIRAAVADINPTCALRDASRRDELRQLAVDCLAGTVEQPGETGSRREARAALVGVTRKRAVETHRTVG